MGRDGLIDFVFWRDVLQATHVLDDKDLDEDWSLFLLDRNGGWLMRKRRRMEHWIIGQLSSPIYQVEFPRSSRILWNMRTGDIEISISGEGEQESRKLLRGIQLTQILEPDKSRLDLFMAEDMLTRFSEEAWKPWMS